MSQSSDHVREQTDFYNDTDGLQRAWGENTRLYDLPDAVSDIHKILEGKRAVYVGYGEEKDTVYGDAKLVGVDVADESLKRTDYPGIRGNGCDLPVADNSVDVTYFWASLHHMPDIKKHLTKRSG